MIRIHTKTSNKTLVYRMLAFIFFSFSAILSAARAGAEPLADFVLPPAPSTSAVYFSSDHFDYERSSDVIHLKGRVELRPSTSTVQGPASSISGTTVIRAEDLWLYLETRRAEAIGFVKVEDEKGVLFGDGGEFYLTDKTGKVRDASAGFPPWRVYGTSAAFDHEHNIDFKRARFTSCNVDPIVHYYVWANRLHIKPNRYMVGTHAVFFVRKVPVFYTPFFWKSLDPDPLLRTTFREGRDQRNGWFGKSATLYDPKPYLHGKLYLDYYQLQGWGVGNETVVSGPGVNGGIYAYRIQEHVAGTPQQRAFGRTRWVVVGDDFQRLAESLNFQMRLQAQSDANFNNDYSRSNRYPVTPELFNSAALVRNDVWGTTRLSYSRYDVEDRVLNHYVKQTESYPRLDFNSAPIPVFRLPLVNTVSAFADHTYTRGQSYLQRTAGLGWTTSQSFNLFRGVSLTPSAGFNETYLARSDQVIGGIPHTFLDSFTARYNGSANLRVKTFLGDWDLAQSYQTRLRTDTLNIDKDANDKGVETNALSLSDAFYPHHTVYFRIQSAYDWRTFRDRTIGFRDRVQPITTDLNWNITSDWNLTLRDHYQLTNGDQRGRGNQAFAAQADWGRREGRFLSFGMSHSIGNVEHYYTSQEFGWQSASGTWRLGGAFRSDIRTAGGVEHLNSLQLFEKGIWVSKNFHDFYVRLSGRMRPGGVKEGSIDIRILIDNKRWVKTNEDHFSAPWRLWRSAE